MSHLTSRADVFERGGSGDAQGAPQLPDQLPGI